jgi:hypothetical protein
VVTLSMTSLALMRLAAGHPERADQHRRWVEQLAELALEPSARDFDTGRWHSDALATLDGDEGHVGYLGHLGLVLGAECALGSTRHRETFRAVGDALRRRFLAAADGLVDTYPEQKWLPDSAAALAVVELHARCFDLPSARAVFARWPREPSGLFRFTPGTSARGSGAGFISVYLTLIDEQVVGEQWALMKKQYGVEVLGLCALREWPHGDGRGGDVDSGPLPFGLSPAATGFGLAAASATGDAQWRSGILRTAEAAGLTVPFGGPHYLFAPLVGDAAVLAARTSSMHSR